MVICSNAAQVFFCLVAVAIYYYFPRSKYAIIAIASLGAAALATSVLTNRGLIEVLIQMPFATTLLGVFLITLLLAGARGVQPNWFTHTLIVVFLVVLAASYFLGDIQGLSVRGGLTIGLVFLGLVPLQLRWARALMKENK